MPRLPTDLLDRLASVDEVDVITHRTDGSTRRPIPIWVVTTRDGAYIRSWRGPHGSWYRHATHAGHVTIDVDGIRHYVTVTELSPSDASQRVIDAAYRAKYARFGGSYLDPMLAERAVASTLLLGVD